ncbi:hypothetical protein DIURU_003336 [Diutina rugosa]|uniref:Rab-GAP TBC domain-containing protein n=1 Tax=Diutina rugosa TaxID=5481 RepID=A0A642UMP4_DIURU|nr:uncharacterized protein DIURU_003336 [Diutina rugosa]KAA8900966.1 hypothetical protein DIURU_003336 [Diutina rugosa]
MEAGSITVDTASPPKVDPGKLTKTSANSMSAQAYEIPPELPPRSSYMVSEFPKQNGVTSPVNSTRTSILKPLAYSVDDPVSKICVVRQTELYGSPQMNESSDLFSVSQSNIDRLKQRIGAVDTSEGEALNREYWKAVLDDRNNEFIRDGHIDELEQRLIEGIPDNLRALVYLKTLQVRYNINHKDTYDTLLKRAKQSRSGRTISENGGYIDRLDLDQNLKDILRIFIYYTNEVVGAAQRVESANVDVNINDDVLAPSTIQDIQPPNYFVIHICKVLAQIPNLDDEELLYLLLKFNKLFVNLIKDEFFYKINRSMEELLPQIFKHIAKNGINLVVLYKKLLYNFFTDQFGDSSQLTLKLLDFFVYQGFDFLLRVVIWCFQQNQDKILDLEGDSLYELLNSHAFWNTMTEDSLYEVLQTNPKVIKYENEFHLIYANSFNNKNNELTNLREVNDDLIIKVNELRQQLASLKTTHEEILQQNAQFKDQLTQEVDQRKALDKKRSELQSRYEHLSMKENVTNTKKANEEFAARNEELVKQIEELKKSIATKKAKLGRA